MVAVVASTNLDVASACCLLFLSAIQKDAASAATAVPAAIYGFVSIGAIPATAEAPIRPIPSPWFPAIIAPIPAVPRAIDAPPDHLPTFS